MPDIFMQKTEKVGSEYYQYYEIYLQRQFQGKQMYCLDKNNANMHVLKSS